MSESLFLYIDGSLSKLSSFNESFYRFIFNGVDIHIGHEKKEVLTEEDLYFSYDFCHPFNMDTGLDIEIDK